MSTEEQWVLRTIAKLGKELGMDTWKPTDDIQINLKKAEAGRIFRSVLIKSTMMHFKCDQEDAYWMIFEVLIGCE